MNYRRRVYIACFSILFSLWAVFAANTLIAEIAGWQVAVNPGSSNTRIMTLGDGDIKYMNKWNDENPLGDYFLWYYYDPAYGFFQMDSSANPNHNVRVSNVSVSSCGSGFNGYKLIWNSYNPDFGFMNFNYDVDNYAYICIPQDGNDDSLSWAIYWYAYSPYIGFQNFDGISLDPSVDRGSEHASEWRFLKVDGIASTQDSNEAIWDQFSSDVRILGKITKSTLKKKLQQNVYSSIRNVSPENGSAPYSVSNLWANKWWSWDGKLLNNGEVLFFWNIPNQNVIVGWNDAITGSKTLVVEGANIYITWNIRWSGMLWLIALEKDGQGWNIYIDPQVTDIHAIMYADRSLISYDGANELDGSTQADEVANQLYIYGSIFSANTIGGSLTTTCPYYVASSDCDSDTSEKYDLNLLRRYILVQPLDVDWNPTGPTVPQFNAAESFMNQSAQWLKTSHRIYPLVIEYNSRIQQTPPPLFD